MVDKTNYMTTQEVKILTGLNSAVLFRLRESGDLPFIKISNKTILYEKEGVYKLLG